jgi:hypothetical protein
MAVVALVSTACEPVTNPDEKAAGIEIVSGDNQTATVGTQLAEDVVIRVVDAAGAPVEGVRVHFTMSWSDGRIVPAGNAPPARVTALDSSVLSGPEGRARTRVVVGEMQSSDPAIPLLLGARIESAGVDSTGLPRIVTLIRVRTRPDAVATIVAPNAPPVLAGIAGEEFVLWPLFAKDRFGNVVLPVTFVLHSADSTIAIPTMASSTDLLVRFVRAGETRVSARVGAAEWSLPVRAVEVDGVTLSPKLGTSYNPGVASLTLAAGEPVAISEGRVMRLRAGQWSAVAGAPVYAERVTGAADGSMFVLAGIAPPGVGVPAWKLWWTRDGSAWRSIDVAYGAVVATGNGARPTLVFDQFGVVTLQQLGPGDVWEPVPLPPTIGDSVYTNGSVAVAGPDDLWLSLAVRRQSSSPMSRAVVWRRRAGAWSRVEVPLGVSGVSLDSLNEVVSLANGEREGRVRAMMLARRYFVSTRSSGLSSVTSRAMKVESGALSYITEPTTIRPGLERVGTDDRGFALLYVGLLADSVLIETPTGFTPRALLPQKTASGLPVGDANAIWVPLLNGQLLRFARP